MDNTQQSEWKKMRNKQGDLSRVVKSIDNISVGKIVQCISIAGQHSQYGSIWLVRGKEEMVTEYGGIGTEVHMPDDWLVPIAPGELDKITTSDKELVHDE